MSVGEAPNVQWERLQRCARDGGVLRRFIATSEAKSDPFTIVTFGRLIDCPTMFKPEGRLPQRRVTDFDEAVALVALVIAAGVVKAPGWSRAQGPPDLVRPKGSTARLGAYLDRDKISKAEVAANAELAELIHPECGLCHLPTDMQSRLLRKHLGRQYDAVKLDGWLSRHKSTHPEADVCSTGSSVFSYGEHHYYGISDE